MRTADAIVEVLKREGVSTLFCFPTTSLIENAVAAGIRPIICRQERVGVDMADGFARVTNGKPPGVFMMQYGPGSENAFPGIATTFSDSVPVLFLPLAHARDQSQIFPTFRSSRTYASITKQVEEIVVPQATTAAMRRAFNALKNGRPGPVMVEVPRDIVDLDAGDDAMSYRPIVPTISAPNARDVDEAAKMLLAASHPMILAGQGVLYAEASDELVELANLLQAPVMTTVDGKSAFPEDHSLALGSGGNTFSGPGRLFLHTKTDLIFGVGCGFTKHPLTTPALPRNVPIIHATNDPRDLHKSYQTEVALLGDAKLTLGSLIAAVKDRLGSKRLNRSPAAELAAERERWLARWHARLSSAETPMTPYRVMSEFTRVVDPAEAIVTHDSGSPRDQLLPFYRATRPRGYLGWGKSHQLGTGLGLIIGAKVAAPDKFCVNFMGDAAFGMTGLDLETAVRAGIPSLTIVLNNNTMAIEIPHMKLSHDRHKARDLGGRYADLAKDLGAWSERVADPGDIANAIIRAKRATEDGQTALLEFITSAETEFSHRNGGEI
ncbi:MAG: acetolactate synthase large subunit [Acetobacteraceae bacterium]|jgi:acetolactate synthase-1/2/3 large subunit|nr:acetolactate synthase large subunit [Acetobacteraceae bacterium]